MTKLLQTHIRITLVAAMAMLTMGCDATTSTEASPSSAEALKTTEVVQELSLSDAAMREAGITTGPVVVERRDGSFETSAVLRLDETRTSRIGSLVDGVVTAADVEAGARVARGARLASVQTGMVHEAWAEYRRAIAEQRRASTELEFAKSVEARAARLLAAKAASPQEVERARTDRQGAEQALAIADSELKRALDELDHLGISPDNEHGDAHDAIPVRTTIAGAVLERLVSTGTAVTTGTPLFVVSDLSRLWAIAEVDEARLPVLAVGRTADLTVAAYPERAFSARVIAVGDTVNPDTRRVTVRLEVDNRAGALKPQMFATVRLSTADDHEVVMVPAAAIQKFAGDEVVFVETRPGRFRRQVVTAGAEYDGRVVIESGLAGTDRIATGGTFLIKSKFLEFEGPK